MPSEHCLECDGPLVPAHGAPDTIRVSVGADYVCVVCRQSYEWVGDPPKLMPVAPIPNARKTRSDLN